MFALYYGMIFAASLTCAALYIYIWHKHFDVNFTLIFTLIPIACLGYLLSALARSLEAAIIGQQIIYIGGSFLQLFIVFSIFNLCKVEVPKYLRLILFAFCAIVYASVLTIGHLDWFYTKVSFEMIGSRPILHKEYGIMHTVFYVLVCLYLITGIITIIYSWIRKKEIPRRILIMLIFPDIVCVINYFIILKVFNLSVDLVPLGYIFAQLIYLLIAYRVNLYDVSNTVIDSFVQEQKVGYISFDFNLRYLGSNQVAKDLVPELNDIAIDELFGYKPSQRKIRHFLDSFRQNNENNTFVYVVNGPDDDSFEDDQFYNVNVNYLYDGKWKRGYIITFIDDTPNRKYIKLLDSYNDTLKKEVDDKTRHIVEMHDNLIMGLAMMVESRDNSTGGHIKRTSEGVRLLIDEILGEGNLDLSDEFCKDVIKAAPMHDLGKIAVDDDILRKPGRFTPEEFEKMKAHAAEGAKVIHEILLHTDDDSFKKVAENVAHYHHERWDGSGYPEKLAGEQIPIEARIMAIADVYDALVSKRVYKEAFDFARADKIIMEGMGSQFDPRLQSVYEKARPKLEAYYASLAE
ncbi:MAG: HD domain-containing protein [Erysipelotrichaceae bacterium]|nr:HD domain-containing protein [Erysipelotrichaceae bacterium]